MSVATHAATRSAMRPAVDAPSARAAGRQRDVAALVVEGAGLALLVGWEGFPLWRAVRVVVVTLLTAGVAEVALRSTGGIGRRVAMVAWGVIGVIAGAGVAFAHLGRGVLTPRGFAGALTALAAVTVLWSQRRVLRRRPVWTRVVAHIGALLAFALLLWTFVPAVMTTNGPPIQLGERTPADLGLTYRDVTFHAADDVTLAGWFVPGTNGAGIVLRHGAASTRSSVLGQLAVLNEAGFTVLATDARGRGESDGRPMDFGWYGDEDIAGAIDFLQAQPEVEQGRIGVLGMSMGGEEAIGAAAADTRIRAVVAEGATGRTASDGAWLSNEYGIRGQVQELLDVAEYTLVDLLTEASSPISLRAAALRSDAPILVIAGGAVPTELIVANRLANSDADVVAWTVPGAAHMGGLRTAEAEWTDRVVSFLSDALLGEGGTQ